MFDWGDQRFIGFVTRGLDHFNAARSEKEALDRSWALASGLEQLKDGYVLRGLQGDVSAFTQLVCDGLSPAAKTWLVSHSSLEKLAAFSPLIQNEDTLARAPEYRPEQPVSNSLRRKAEHEHQQFRNAHRRWSDQRDSQSEATLLKKLAILVYEVRSHIAHGVKRRTPRDTAVAEICLPIFEALADAALEFPSTRLAAYGTLRSGHSNDDLVAGIEGDWLPAIVRGRSVTVRSLPALEVDYSADPVAIDVLTSHALSGEWERLDRFEAGYRRILALVTLEKHPNPVVANIYVL